MCIAATASRRRAQCANGYRHIDKMKRPHYSKIDSGISAQRMAQRIATEKRIRQGKK